MPPIAFPPLIVKFCKFNDAPESTKKTLKLVALVLPDDACSVTPPFVGPWIVIAFPATTSAVGPGNPWLLPWPDKEMVAGQFSAAAEQSNVMTSPLFEPATAARNEPIPESVVVVTVSVFAPAGDIIRAATTARKMVRKISFPEELARKA